MGQRPGPATGLPTRTEQGELAVPALRRARRISPLFSRPARRSRPFICQQSLRSGRKIPDPGLHPLRYLPRRFSQWTLDGLDTDKIRIHRLPGAGRGIQQALTEYKRHAFTETGVSPLAVPGDGNHVVVTDSDEHDEDGTYHRGCRDTRQDGRRNGCSRNCR